MDEITTKPPATPQQKVDRPAEWRPFEGLRREVDRLFEDFQLGAWRSPFGRGAFDVQPFWRGDLWSRAPAVDIVDKENAYEISAELPGVDENSIDVKFSDGTLTIRAISETNGRRKRRIFIWRSAATAPSSVRSASRRASTPTGSRRVSRMAC
jgi:HSP20 family protein